MTRYGSEMRVLIVGGGIAGLTLAGLLQQRGFRPTVLEKAHDYADAGYALGLFPAGSRILKGLGLYRRFVEAGTEMQGFEICNAEGRLLHSYSMQGIAEQFGPTVCLSRAALLGVLREAVPPESLRLGVTVDEITETEEGARVTFSDRSMAPETFDLVAGCDGIGSRTRRLVFGERALTYMGMTGWGFWVDPSLLESGWSREYWGDGKMFGLYPTKDRLCVFTGVRLPAGTPDPVETRIARIREHFKDFGDLVPQILAALTQPEMIFHGDYNDVKLDEWHRGRVVLVGDAAHAVLPTAGVGASMAMESAAVLAEELCRADSGRLGLALKDYVARRRPRVDRVQAQSRLYGKAVCLENPLLTAARDAAIHAVSSDRFLQSWESLMAEPL